jgi:mannose-6-phosphate isomerase-like protein (cupin superfamily)
MRTPKNHINFKALQLAAEIDDEIMDCAIAYIEPNGGGPLPDHTHPHDHLFTVISGKIEIRLRGEKIILNDGMSLKIPGCEPHSVWNVSENIAKVLGVSLKKADIQDRVESPPTDVTDQIRNAEELLRQAMLNSDVDTLDQLLAPSSSLLII